jgi:hypothetical protein
MRAASLRVLGIASQAAVYSEPASKSSARSPVMSAPPTTAPNRFAPNALAGHGQSRNARLNAGKRCAASPHAASRPTSKRYKLAR